MKLSKMPLHKEAVITKVGGERHLRCRLLDMGLIPHTKVEVCHVAPLGDPIEIRIRDYKLTLRKEDADNIEVLPPEAARGLEARAPENREADAV